MWKLFGLIIFAGALAGSIVGVSESLQLLLAVGAGEYDALLWGGVGYSVLGGLIAIPMIAMSWWGSTIQIFVRTLVGVGASLCIWIYDASLWWLVGTIPIYWFLTILIGRTPLRALLNPKGAIGFLTLWFTLLTIFSLTPGQRIYSAPIHQRSSTGKPNVLFVVVDGLAPSMIHESTLPQIRALSHSAIEFDRTLSNAPDRFGGVAALLRGKGDFLPSPIPDTVQTLPEVLAFEGYQTYGMISHLDVGRFSNLHQGFDKFRYMPPKMDSVGFRMGLGSEGSRHLKLAKILLRWIPVQRRPLNEIVQIFNHDITQFKQSSPEPVFALLHLTPIHPVTQRNLEQLDTSLRFLLDDSIFRDGLVVLTSPFQYLSHNQIEQSIDRISVPLLMWLPGVSGKKVSNNVLLSDVSTTVLSILGFDRPSSGSGRNMLRLPPMNDSRIIQVQQPGWVLRQQGKWRWVRQQNREALYDVVMDPHLTNNLIEEHPTVVEQLRLNKR